MLKEFVGNHMFMSSILLFGVVSLLLQAVMTLSLKGYVKASANMKTTRKKVMINLKNQFETIYGMDYQVRNIAAYVDKYLLKLRFMGFSFSIWEKMPFLTAGFVTLLAGGEAFYGYMTGVNMQTQVEILFSYGVVLVCLFVFFHIFGIKSKKEQIQIQLVDYLENYLTNRLIRTKEGSKQLKLLDDEMEAAFMEGTGKTTEFDKVMLEEQKKWDTEGRSVSQTTVEEDMEMLKRLLREMDTRQDDSGQEMIAASDEQGVAEMETEDEELEVSEWEELRMEVSETEPEESEIELLEEFVQSFLA